MKFLESEYSDLMKAITDEGYDQVDFSFSKKKGMLHIQRNSLGDSFCFFRTKESLLKDGKFVDHVKYAVGPKKIAAPDGWKEVLTGFRQFLSGDD